VYGALRKGLWLRRREGSGAGWQLRWLEGQTALRLLIEPAEVVARLEQELGPVEGVEAAAGVEAVLEARSLKQMLTTAGREGKWRAGGAEVEVRREGQVETAVVRVAGEVRPYLSKFTIVLVQVLAAVQELQASAERFKLRPLVAQSLQAAA
jgi:hypothetical protein